MPSPSSFWRTGARTGEGYQNVRRRDVPEGWAGAKSFRFVYAVKFVKIVLCDVSDREPLGSVEDILSRGHP